MAAVVYKQAVQRALSIGTTDIKVTERGAVVQVQRLQNGMAHVGQVKFKDTAGAVEVLGIVHDKVCVKSKLDKRTRVFGKNRTLMRGSAGIAVTEIITLAGLDPDLAVVTAEPVAEIGGEAVLAVSTANVLAVKKGKTVPDGIGTVGVAVALQGIEIIIEAGPLTGSDSLGQRLDILELAVLIVNPFAPVAHHLIIEYLKHVFKAHRATELVGHFTELIGAAADKFPQDGIMSGKGVAADTIVKSGMGDGIVIFQNGIVTAA